MIIAKWLKKEICRQIPLDYAEVTHDQMRLATYSYRKLTNRYQKVLNQWKDQNKFETTQECPKILRRQMGVEELLYMPPDSAEEMQR